MEDNTAKDLFSNLPNEILRHIVSFLPNESALETIFLSTRWRNLWNEALVRHGTKENITQVVAGFLQRFEELDPLKHPRKLQFHFGEGRIVMATIANNSKLFLDFSTWKKELIEIQYELQFKLSKMQSFTSNISVKTLYLKSISYLTSGVASTIISNLEHLENLVIIECSGLQSLSIDSASELQKLTIWDCLQLSLFTLELPNSNLFK